MVDSIQRQSSVPLPDFQTGQGARNPLPLDAPKEEDRLEDAAKTKAGEQSADRFEDYLNQPAGIAVVDKTEKKGLVFDAAADIAASSVYGMPGGRTRI